MSSSAHNAPIIQAGHNCWRTANASRAAMLVDGQEYFRAVHGAISAARHSVFILGWDIDSRLRLIDEPGSDDLPAELGHFLDAVLERRRNLHVRVLSWDFAMIYALEREWLPVFRLEWNSHRRMHFLLDDKHPFGGSQHQKIVVVDDRVAFCGGMDLSKWRWDTTAHAADEPGRIDPDGKNYPPYHDVQMLVEGDAAAALGELARQRWQWASGEKVAAADSDGESPWPSHVSADFADVDVAIARTFPAYAGREEVREVERMHIDAIAAARNSIYIENQYLTSHRLVAALADRLREDDGPEVLVVLPKQTGGRLEQLTMDVLRARVLGKLTDADRHGRLRVRYPETPGLGDRCISVHSKLMVIDDRILRIGSSNLSNRSMGLDSECDLAIESGGRDGIRAAIARLRNRLLAEHLDCTPEQVETEIARTGSLLAAVERLNTGDRGLRRLEARVDEDIDRLVPDSAMIDPEKPIDADALAREFIDEQEAEPARRSVGVATAVLLAALALAAAWRWSPLAEWLDLETLQAIVRQAAGSPLTPVLLIAGIVLGSVAMVPLTLMIVASVLVFGPFIGGLYALCGGWLGSIAGYGIGSGLGRSSIRRLAGARLNTISRRLAKRGVVTVAAARLLPVAPFTIVNMVAGASHIRFRDFAIGSAIGLLPGTIAVALFVETVASAVRTPSMFEVAMVAAVLLAILGGSWTLRVWLRRLSNSADSGASVAER
ncbi:MAG: VTT domain-containing protein [Burkholderiales bacterium]